MSANSLIREKGFAGFLVAACIYTAFFSAYLGSSLYSYGFGFILLLLRLHKLRLTHMQFLSVVLLITYMLFVLINAISMGVILQNIRFWYGFVVFMLFFKVCDDSRIATPRFFYLVCVTVILEAILVNTIIDPQVLYGKGAIGTLFGFYQRPISFAFNASMSSGALVVLYSLVDVLNPGKLRLRDFGLLLGCVILISAATGFLLVLVMLLLRALRTRLLTWQWLVTWVVTLAIIAGAYFVSTSIKIEDFQKGSFEYLQMLYLSKTGDVSISSTMEKPWLDFLLGSQIHSDVPVTSGDFGWLKFFLTCGVVGVFIFALLLYAFYQSGVILLPILFLLLIGVVHYPVAMSQAGQLLLAFILVGTSSNKRFIAKT